MENTNDKKLNIVTPINTKESKKIDFEKLDIAGLSDYINNLSDFNVSNSEHKEIAKKFLKLMASKNAQKSTLEAEEIPSHFDILERRALSKVFDLVKAYYSYKEWVSIVLWYTDEKLNLLQNYIDGKELVINSTSKEKEVVKSNVSESINIKKESKEKRAELKLEKDEEKAIIKYLGISETEVSEINLVSALTILSKTNWNLITKEDWEKAWYNDSWILFQDSELEQLNKLDKVKVKKLKELNLLGISALELVNTQVVLEANWVDKVLETAFDYNTDWNIDNLDKHINNSKEILDYANKMIKTGKSVKLFSSISHLLWEKVSDKKSLYTLLLSNPELKFKLINEIKRFTWAGDAGATFVTDILEHWKDATKISMEKKKEANTYINSVLEAKKSSVDRLYDEALEKFKNSLNAEDKKKYEALISSLSSVEAKKSIFENFRLNGAWILVNLVDWHKWVGWATSFTNESVNDFLTKNTESIVKWLNFEVWVANFWGNLVPGVWMSIDLSKDLTEETRAFWKVWIINIIPYALAGLETQINSDTIKKSGFADLSDPAKYAGATVNISTLAWGLGVHYREDQLKSIETQEKSFNEFMTKFISNDGVINEDLVKSQSDYAKNKDYYEKLISNLKETLRIQNFAHLSPEFKKEVIMSIRNSYTFTWRENMLKEASKDWYKFSGIWFGVEFIAGFLPIPVIGASVSKVWMTYDENKLSKVYAIISEAKHIVIRKETIVNDTSILWETKEINTWMDFIWNKALFRNFAQNHPKTWEHLVTTKWLSLDSETNLILSMFKTDKSKNTKFFKEFISKVEAYKSSDNTDDKRKLNELIAGFYDISFADIRSTSEVIMGYTKKWDKYEWSFNFQEAREKAMKRFVSSEWLSSNFVSENQDIVDEIKSRHLQDLKNFKSWKINKAPEIPQIKDPTLFALVASYKIDSKGHSLGKWFVDIPAWQANIADWISKTIKDSKDINYLVNSFCETTSGKNTMIQLINTINTKEAGLISSTNDFKDLLKNWILEKNGKKVSLDRDFIYFLYGQCANESMGLRIKWLKFEGFNTIREVEEVTYGNIAPDWVLAVQSNTTNIPRWVLTTFAAWIVWSNSDEKKDTGSSNNNNNNNWSGSWTSNLGSATGDTNGNWGGNVWSWTWGRG